MKPIYFILLCAGCAVTTPKQTPTSPDLNPAHATALSLPAAKSMSIAAVVLPPTQATAHLCPPGAKVSWALVDDTNVAGYNIYFGTNGSFQQVKTVGLTNSVEIIGLDMGSDYVFALSVNGTDGSEGSPSDKVPYTVKQCIALDFGNPGSGVVSSTDFQTWAPRDALLVGNLWIVVVDLTKPQEFFRNKL